jgi:hypothetical protein
MAVKSHQTAFKPGQRPGVNPDGLIDREELVRSGLDAGINDPPDGLNLTWADWERFSGHPDYVKDTGSL